MPSLKAINAEAGTNFKRWKELMGTLREQQMAASDEWYGWEHYGPKEGWAVENIRLTSMPHYWQDENGNWQADGAIGVNIYSEMPTRPQYIERDGYALRIDIESIQWNLVVTSQVTGEELETGWMNQELQGGLAVLHTIRNKDVGAVSAALLNGELHQVVAYARPRLRRAKYDGTRRTDDLWSTFAAGIGESEPGDTITQSEPYYFQWLGEERYEMLSWPVGAEKPVSHLPWYEAPVEAEVDQDFARWMRESREKIQAQFDFMSSERMSREVGMDGERYAKLEDGELAVEDWERDNIEHVLNAWLGALEG